MEIEEAERNNDIGRASMMKMEKEKLETALKEFFTKKGNERPGRRKEHKHLKDRILNPIKREIINFTSPEIKHHFLKSFKTYPYKFYISYRPDPNIDWETD